MPHLMERQGWECGAVVASHGSAGYYKAPLRSRDAWEDAQGAGLSEGRRGATPFSPSSSPGGLRWDARQALLLARRWTWSAVLGVGLRGSSVLGGLQDLEKSPPPPPPYAMVQLQLHPQNVKLWHRHPRCSQIPWARWVSRVLGGGAC